MQLFYLAFTKLINQALELDKHSKQQLFELDGNCIEIEITDSKLIMFLLIKNNQLDITCNTPEDVSLKISGTTANFVRFIYNHDKPVSSYQLQVSGDIELAQKLQNIFKQLDFDWEEKLSTFTGDIVAHQIGNALRYTKQEFKQASDDFWDMLAEYITEEVKLLPTNIEISNFISDVDILKSDCERLEQRIEKL